MSSLQKHINRVNALSKRLKPNPTIIDCTGAHDELIAMLEQQMRNDGMTEEEIHAPCVLSEEDEKFMEEFGAYLDENIKRIQETHNVRLVSYE